MSFWRWFTGLFKAKPPPLHFGYVGALDLQASLIATSPFTNFAFGSWPNRATLQAAKQNGIKLFVQVGDILFHDDVGTRKLWPDAESRLAVWRRTNGVDLWLSQILAIYVVDEPTWRGVPAADLLRAVDIVKTAFPNIPAAFSESHMALDRLVVPTRADWVGMAVYGIRNPNTDPIFLQYYQTLRSKMTSRQKTIVVLDGWWSPAIHGAAGITPDAMGDVAKNYGAFARAEAEVAAVAAFIWPNVFAPPVLASSDLPSVARAAQEAVGKQLTGK